MQKRKENVQLIVTTDVTGRPVYMNGAPALLKHSLSRLKNILQGQVLHCEDAAYSACNAVHSAPHLLDMNGSHIDDITKMYREDNWDYLKGENKYEIEHWMVDYEGSLVSLNGVENMFFQRGFVSRLHIAQYFDHLPPEGALIGHRTRRLDTPLSPELLIEHGWVLELSEYEDRNFRAGGPTHAKIRHTVWRHRDFPKQTVPVLSVDDSTWAMASSQRSQLIREEVTPNVAGHERVDINDPNYFSSMRYMR